MDNEEKIESQEIQKTLNHPEDSEIVDAAESQDDITFESFGFCDELLKGIHEAGFTVPTLIQQKAIPLIMQGRDVIGQALTGSGKTAAFGLPSMDLIRDKEGLQLLILVPTRELAAQVSSELFRLGHFLNFRTAAFTGGQAYTRQEKLLKEGLNALVATPGRLIDLMNSGHFTGINPSIIVVDEADEMLDMGFLEDVHTIFSNFSGEHQTMLFSATMPKPVMALAKTILHDPVDITTDISATTNNDIEQQFFVIEEHERVNAIIRLIDSEEVTKAMIFCRTREETDSLNILLGGRGYNVNCLHGDMEQAQRSRVMAAFRRGEFDILVATDVAARGLDVEDVSHVFNFHLPFDSRGYVHRIGRTGRAGKSGRAITLVTPRELRQLEAIKRTVGADIHVGLIPTRHAVLAQQVQRVFAELFSSDLDTELYNQVKQVAEGQEQDFMVLFTKLLKRLLVGNSAPEPESIGITGERLEYILNTNGRERRGSSRFGRGGRYEGRGDRFGRRRFEEREERSFGRFDKLERSSSEDERSEERKPKKPSAHERREFRKEHKVGLKFAEGLAGEIERLHSSGLTPVSFDDVPEKSERPKGREIHDDGSSPKFEHKKHSEDRAFDSKREKKFEGKKHFEDSGFEPKREKKFEGKKHFEDSGFEPRREKKFEARKRFDDAGFEHKRDKKFDGRKRFDDAGFEHKRDKKFDDRKRFDDAINDRPPRFSSKKELKPTPKWAGSKAKKK